jgi:hypothetical protein
LPVCVCLPACVYLSPCACLPQPFSEDILASLRELEEVLSDPGAAERPDPPAPDPRLHQEALHYLTSYGTHLALVCFYMRHDRMRDALSHLLSKVGGPRGGASSAPPTTSGEQPVGM